MKAEQKKWAENTGWVSLGQDQLKEKSQLVFIFGERKTLKAGKGLSELKGLYPNARIIGCSTSGEIIGTEVADNTLAATAVWFEKTEVRTVEVKLGDMRDSFQAGKKLAEALTGDKLTHVMVLSPGLDVNGSELAKGLTDGLPANVAVTGGLAGDQARFEETVVLSGDNIDRRMVVGIGFYGDHLHVGYGSRGGWDSFGPDRLVTRSQGNVLYEFDGRSALGIYKEYLGEQAQGLPATALLFPLSLRIKEDQRGLVRTILGVDEKDGSMTFAGDIPQGQYVRFMKANVERLVGGAADAAQMALQVAGRPQPDLAILISCVGRKLVLKQRVEEEIEAVQDVLGRDTAITGFYSYGEVCPLEPEEKRCELHNQTMTITTFTED